MYLYISVIFLVLYNIKKHIQHCYIHVHTTTFKYTFTMHNRLIGLSRFQSIHALKIFYKLSRTLNIVGFLTTMSYMQTELNFEKSHGREIKSTEERLWNCNKLGLPSQYLKKLRVSDRQTRVSFIHTHIYYTHMSVKYLSQPRPCRICLSSV